MLPKKVNLCASIITNMKKQVKTNRGIKDEKLEKHPFGRFPKKPNKAKFILIGSFPPNKFTINKEKRDYCDRNFFYGSKDNSFWSLFIEANQIKITWPRGLQHLKVWLQKNRWVVCDIVEATYRKKNSASDLDLKPQKWNVCGIDKIFAENNIEYIFYTSNWVKRNYKKKVEPHLNHMPNIKNEFVLISPSPAGLISTNWARKILKRNKNETVKQYRSRYYGHVMRSPNSKTKEA